MKSCHLTCSVPRKARTRVRAVVSRQRKACVSVSAASMAASSSKRAPRPPPGPRAPPGFDGPRMSSQLMPSVPPMATGASSSGAGLPAAASSLRRRLAASSCTASARTTSRAAATSGDGSHPLSPGPGPGPKATYRQARSRVALLLRLRPTAPSAAPARAPAGPPASPPITAEAAMPGPSGDPYSIVAVTAVAGLPEAACRLGRGTRQVPITSSSAATFSSMMVSRSRARRGSATSTPRVSSHWHSPSGAPPRRHRVVVRAVSRTTAASAAEPEVPSSTTATTT
mmetsp:Transcript_1897/g.6284  ORF Transcript_1897/g.6284 Transcript_1897/m.6284 type:complete len:284 (-) Transcript_1897:340-1191(-)